MNVESIRLINFRNYDELNIKLNDKINVFIGKNAQGKTNLLESIYICATGRSFRTNRDKEIINLNRNQAYIGTEIKTNGIKKFIEIKMEKGKQKRIRINKVELTNLKELNSGLRVVFFSPDNLKLIKGGPSERREFLDYSISQTKPIYRYNISKYNKVLFQRNNLLKSNKTKSDILKLLEIFDIQLIKIGTEIIISRNKFINQLSKIAEDIHKNLTSGEEQLLLDYTSSIDFNDNNRNVIEEDFYKKLKANINKDLGFGVTMIGPHRDDIDIKINNMDAKIFASQGQKRTIVLSIKLSEVEIIKLDRGEYPVLLLDDVFSELDEERIKYLTLSFRGKQTIITSTDFKGLGGIEGLNKSIFYIENGTIL